jgi:hypothetical protein
MNAPPMRRWQNAVALAATLLAAGTLLPVAPGVRIALVALAVAVIVLLLVVRLRSHAARRDSARVAGVYDRIERIRAERGKRTGR